MRCSAAWPPVGGAGSPPARHGHRPLDVGARRGHRPSAALAAAQPPPPPPSRSRSTASTGRQRADRSRSGRRLAGIAAPLLPSQRPVRTRSPVRRGAASATGMARPLARPPARGAQPPPPRPRARGHRRAGPKGCGRADAAAGSRLRARILAPLRSRPRLLPSPFHQTSPSGTCSSSATPATTTCPTPRPRAAASPAELERRTAPRVTCPRIASYAAAANGPP